MKNSNHNVGAILIARKKQITKTNVGAGASKYACQTKGITLIALIITIIVLLILAGVTISMLTGDDGIINKAMKAKEITEIASEKEMIQLKLLENKMFLNNNEKIGRELYDKTIENGNKWDIVVLKENNKVYGTGWILIAKNTEIDKNIYTKNDWLLNTNTNEMIELKEDEFTELSYTSAIGVTDGLIFNLDTSVIENADKDTIQQQLGENVELINFNWTDTSGITENSFNLDGVDDYIKIQYDDETEKQKLAENGFTFEFYGIIDEGTAYIPEGISYIAPYVGIFCYWNGDENQQAEFRFGIFEDNNKNSIKWNASYASFQSDYSYSSIWNIFYGNSINFGEELYMTITLDTSNSYIKEGVEYYTHNLYINGERICTGGYNKNSWDYFIADSRLENLKYFCLGRSSMAHSGAWYYSQMNTYATRLYNRGLTEEEVMQNYEKTVAYHNLSQ